MWPPGSAAPLEAISSGRSLAPSASPSASTSSLDSSDWSQYWPRSSGVLRREIGSALTPTPNQTRRSDNSEQRGSARHQTTWPGSFVRRVEELPVRIKPFGLLTRWHVTLEPLIHFLRRPARWFHPAPQECKCLRPTNRALIAV